MFIRVFILCVSFLFLSCDKQQPTFSEVQTSAGKHETEGVFKAENDRALDLENDLARRHRFFQALKGTYEGTIQTVGGPSSIRVTLVPSLPPYPVDPNRVRTIEEVTSDLNSLHFKVQAIQWNPNNKLSVSPCEVEGIHPDMNRGTISIIGGTCQNFYDLLLSDMEVGEKSTVDLKPQDRKDMEGQSANMALAILEGRLLTVQQLRGVLQPGTNAERYEFIVNRIE